MATSDLFIIMMQVEVQSGLRMPDRATLTTIIVSMLTRPRKCSTYSTDQIKEKKCLCASGVVLPITKVISQHCLVVNYLFFK